MKLNPKKKPENQLGNWNDYILEQKGGKHFKDINTELSDIEEIIYMTETAFGRPYRQKPNKVEHS